jgi:hypothetical protein
MQFKYQDTVNRIAQDRWGQDFSTQEEADRHLIDNPQDLTAHAIVELISRLSAVGQALQGSDEDESENQIYEPDDPMDGSDFHVGQKLYGTSCHRIGFVEYIVIAKDESNRLLIIKTGYFFEDAPVPRIARKEHRLVSDLKVALNNSIESAEASARKSMEQAVQAKVKLQSGDSIEDYRSLF